MEEYADVREMPLTAAISQRYALSILYHSAKRKPPKPYFFTELTNSDGKFAPLQKSGGWSTINRKKQPSAGAEEEESH